MRQGEPGEKFYLIRHGSVDVLMDDGRATSVVGQLGVNEYFGERALLSDQPHNVSIRAREDVEVLALDKPAFHASLDASKSFKDQLLNVFFTQL